VSETFERFDCFGGGCAVLLNGRGPAGVGHEATGRIRRRMLQWHRQFSRFDPDSELSRLNRDEREVVSVSAMMLRFLAAARAAAQLTGGLVDPTLVGELESAGYARSLSGHSAVALQAALSMAPSRRPAAPRPHAAWRSLVLDPRAGTVARRPGTRFDSGGIAKGLFVDILADAIVGHPSFAVDACGDVRFGGSAGVLRPIQVSSPFDETIVHVFELARGAAATSGISRRAWLGAGGHPAHHLLDPATGRPAYTGVVQATALAPTGVEAEARAKAAVLSGPRHACAWLVHGGVVVLDDGSVAVVPESPALSSAPRATAAA
jgi:thiamine biosynthesis lipoprotein